jgi:hypothetical protein
MNTQPQIASRTEKTLAFSITNAAVLPEIEIGVPVKIDAEENLTEEFIPEMETKVEEELPVTTKSKNKSK